MEFKLELKKDILRLEYNFMTDTQCDSVLFLLRDGYVIIGEGLNQSIDMKNAKGVEKFVRTDGAIR